MAKSDRMNPVRKRIRRWASSLPDGVVIHSMLLLGLLMVSLIMAAITVLLLQILRLAGGDEHRISIIGGVIFMLGAVLALPLVVVFACLVDLMEGLIGARCPNCRQRELVWRSGSWKYGDPPDYRYFACADCGARFRQLCGGQGVLSGLEKF